MLASSSSPPSTPASATGDDEFELDNRQRNDSADASPTFRQLVILF
jgi:hypothetical protein